MKGDTSRQTFLPGLISPEPKYRNHNIRLLPKKNPFIEFPSIKTIINAEEYTLEKELYSILSKPVTVLPPITKKSSSPNCFNKLGRLPSRQKANPLIFDEKFIEINSSLSTCES